MSAFLSNAGGGGGGGSTSPGGSTGDLQWNNGGAFAGVTGTALTANQPFNLAQTWNNGAVAFTGLKFNVTNTASDSASRYLQVNGGASGTTELLGLTSSRLFIPGGHSLETQGGNVLVFNTSGGGSVGQFTAGGFYSFNNNLFAFAGQFGPFAGLSHDGTNAKITWSSGQLVLSALPTSDPGVSGALYTSAGVVMQSP